MRSILMHMNEKVADVELLNGLVKKINKLYEKELLPIGARNSSYINLSQSLSGWQKMRSIPDDRVGLSKILSLYEIEKPTEIYEISRGISLTDTYWFKPTEVDLKWEDLNYHRNGFSENFAKAVILNGKDIIVDTNTPDLTTDGTLKKAWVVCNNSPLLLKEGNLGPNGKNHLLSANEIIAEKIADICNVPSARYTVVNLNNSEEKICGSFCFIQDDKTDFVNALQYIRDRQVAAAGGLYEFFETLGFKKEIDRMILFDHLIHNTDRHEKNFGVLIDAETGNIKGFAPLFDNGSCLGWNQISGEPHYNISKPFEDNFETQLQLVKNFNFKIPEYEKILPIIEDTYKKFGIEETQFNKAKIELRCGIKDLERLRDSIQIQYTKNEEFDR